MEQALLPTSPSEITPAWLTTILRANRILTTQAVVAIQTTCIGQDRGFTGVVTRVQLHYSGYTEAAPSSVVVKLPLAQRETSSAYRHAQDKDAVIARRYFERSSREVLFYQQLASLSHITAPCCYYGAVDDRHGRIVLVLEDLHTAREGDALHGCSLQDATLVIDQLAHLHAQWWDSRDLDAFHWLPQWGGDAHVAQQRYLQHSDHFLQRFGSRVPKRIQTTIDRLNTAYAAVRERLQQTPTTLIHGDLHLDNLLFASPTQEPAAIFIDWQGVSRGRGVIDLALFLFGALETSTRRESEDELLRRYYNGLLAGGVTRYNFSQLEQDCRLALLWLLGSQVSSLGSIDIEHLSEREQALLDASLSEEGFAAFLDHDVDTLLPF